MGKKPFGCLTVPGLVTAVLTALIVLVVGLARGGELFSPGELNAKAGAALGGVISHAELGGNCSACHGAFWQKTTMADHCVVCHKDLLAQKQDLSTLHGILLKDNPGVACQFCHPDHLGPNAVLTDLSKATITHSAFGYALTGHKLQADGTAFTCKTCHPVNYSKYDTAVCVDCHERIKAGFMQTHRLAYGDKCLVCHDGIDTYGPNFNHSRVAFQLTGKHAQVDCAGCHSGARSLADLKSTSQDCSSCHAKDDAHEGQLGNACGACHSTNGWKPSTFDHSLSKFPLTGAHAGLACTKCHLNGVLAGLSTDCFSCHAKDDAHKGQLGTSCGACHSTTGWLPPTFDHSLSMFPLTGAHAKLACTQCHLNDIFTTLPIDCVACHAKDDAHKGQFGNDCGMCHSTISWLPPTFDHSRTIFPLTGAHVRVACMQCHKIGIFTGLSTACAACHATPAFHAGLFLDTPCDQCHNTSAWSPAIYNGPHPGGCDGNCINHGGASCRDCHTVNLSTATCTKCHGSNTPGDGGGGGGG